MDHTEKPKKLTAKQKKFAKEYQKDGNGTRAAIAAGYSKDSAAVIATENLRKPNVAEVIKKDLDKTLEKLGIDAEYILGSIVETMERCKQAKPVFTKMGEHAVTEDANGDMATAYEFDANAVLKGAELLGKYKNLKLWTDKVEHSGDKDNPIVVKSLTQSEINQLIQVARGEKES